MRGHNGIDIAGLPYNYVLVPGNFHSTGYDAAGYGNWVKIKDDAGHIWTYAHFKHRIEARGRLELFDNLGEMGTTGYSTGVHCHVGVKPQNPDQNNGYLGSIDPLPLILEAIKPITPPKKRMIKLLNNNKLVWIKAPDQTTAEFWIIRTNQEHPLETRHKVKDSIKEVVMMFGEYGKMQRVDWPEIAGLEEKKPFDLRNAILTHPELFETS